MEVPVIYAQKAAAWETWLSKNHMNQQGVWLKIAKKASGLPAITHNEALDIALCYGWIDGQRKSYDTDYFIQKFTPRRPRSLWSQRNVAKVEALVAAGKMQPSGLTEVDAAQQDGRWDAAYASPKDMPFPKDFEKAITNHKARAYFETLTKSERFAIAFRLATARTPEVRARRFAKLLSMLEAEDLR